ncbi:MAG: hypothetical protein KGL35_32220, partial [Bradyrhizobium sp.]|nr:hypothetical protein [Bradyrhizobium sp.]
MGGAPIGKKVPTLQRDLGCPASARKIFRFAFEANHLFLCRVLFLKEGRWPSSRTLERDAVDVEAYGEVVWFGRPDAGVKLAVMLRITPATVTTKPGRREEHEGNRKTIAQEMPDVSGGPVVTNARAFYTTRAAAGALSARHFLRPH